MAAGAQRAADDAGAVLAHLTWLEERGALFFDRVCVRVPCCSTMSFWTVCVRVRSAVQCRVHAMPCCALLGCFEPHCCPIHNRRFRMLCARAVPQSRSSGNAVHNGRCLG